MEDELDVIGRYLSPLAQAWGPLAVLLLLGGLIVLFWVAIPATLRAWAATRKKE